MIETVLIVLCFLEMFKLLEQLNHIENYLVQESELEKYLGLVKIILINFFIAHCLSIILNVMANFEVEGVSWHDLKDLDGQHWFQKYIWGYYWGTTIMLTVGFGDLSANNYI